MTAAIFGLLGVFVGGVLQMVAEWLRTRRTARRRERVGALLIIQQLELLDAAYEVLDTIAAAAAPIAGQIVSPNRRGLLGDWEEYRADLTNIPDWTKLSAAMSALAAVEHLPDGYTPPPEQATDARDAINDARTALAHPATRRSWW